MKKLSMQTPDLTEGNISKIAELFPNVITEREGENGVIEKSVDFELLKQTLSKEIVEDDNERYRLDWPGKKASLLKANTPITKTLRPDIDSSVDFNTTENVFIEGDNFEVLKVLQESYLGKIKMIYIDPPYNTGRDFVYRDNRFVSKEDYEDELGTEDDEGGKLFKNTDTNGRFHSDWLSMMYERLIIARDLLKEDGVIFVSIGEDEIQNLSNILNEIFGEGNRVGICSRLMKSGSNQGKHFSKNIDYVLVYAKDVNFLPEFREEMGDELIDKVYTQVETTGEKIGKKYRTMGLFQPSLEERINQRFWIKCPDGSLCIPPGESIPEKKIEGEKVIPNAGEGVWRWTYSRYSDEFSKGNIEFKKTKNSPLLDEKGLNSCWNIYTKIWLEDRMEDGKIPVDLITKFENRHSSKEIQKLGIPFDFSKPVGLIKFLIKILNSKEGIILDFFAGSGTTAHSVIELNAEDGGDRKFVMVQIAEETEADSEAHRAGYKYISDISKERIRRAGKKVLEENEETLTKRVKPLDVGFRSYSIDTTNMKDVYYHPSLVDQEDLFNQISNIKDGRKPDDLLTQVILNLGLTLDLPIESRKIKGSNVYFVSNNALVACFDDEIDFVIVDEIAKLEPLKVVFKDASFKEEQDRTNLETRFKRLSPDTIITVL